eukprot:12851160-Alexandrium_andersonii.AAC.1
MMFVTYQYKEIVMDGIPGVWAAVVPWYPSFGGEVTCEENNTFERIKDYFEQPQQQQQLQQQHEA